MIDKPIRIAHVIGKYLGGGVEAVVMNYYRNIDKSKIQFDFLCDNDSTDIPYDEIEKLGGKVILIPPYEKIFDYQKTLIKIFKENNYKIVHSHINTLSVFPLRAAKKAGIPVRIAHSHSTTSKIEWKKNIVKQILKPFAKIYATDYMACTEHAGRWLFGNKIYNKNKVYLLNNAIDLSFFKYNKLLRNQLRKELEIDNNTLVIGHVGRFVKQKNHSFLIDVFNEVHKKNKNSILVLVGQGPLVDETKQKIKELNLTKYVKFVGQRTDVNKFYQGFDYFLFPSLYEGLGMVAIEAQCAGLKCLCSTNVPKVAKATNNIKFLDLNNLPSDWATTILNSLEGYIRKDCSKEIALFGYDIKLEVKKLENKYMEMYERIK